MGERSISVTPQQGSPGDTVTVTASGFPPDTEVVVGAGPPQSEYDEITRVRTDAAGRLQTTVRVPESAAQHRELVFVVATPDARLKEVSDPFAVGGRGGNAANQTMTITGTVTGEGVECPAIRTEDGTLYTIAGGDRQQLREGTRVRVTGTVAEMSICMQGTTISASRVEVLPVTR